MIYLCVLSIEIMMLIENKYMAKVNTKWVKAQ